MRKLLNLAPPAAEATSDTDPTQPLAHPCPYYGRRSTILTSQIPVDKWHAFIADPTYADAIVHNESLRRRRSRSISKD